MGSFKIDQQRINNLIETSRMAGEAIMKVYKTDFNIQIKKDSSPVTEADLASHEIITSNLKKLTPNIPVISEESCRIPLHERAKWGEYWLIDPLDGTKEFIKKNDEFTTNIALLRNNKPVLGIIHVPAYDETYWGSENLGSYELCGDSQSDAKEMRVSSDSDSKLRIVSSRSHPSGDLKILLDRLKEYELVSIGSSLKFCLVAKGEADCYPRLGPTSEWDTAAGEAIARFSGAMIVDLKNQNLCYNSRKDFLNPYFIVSNNISNKEKILSLL